MKYKLNNWYWVSYSMPFYFAIHGADPVEVLGMVFGIYIGSLIVKKYGHPKWLIKKDNKK